MTTCPYCGSSDVNRIGLYEYECNSCSETFDASEAKTCDDSFPDD